LRKEEEEDQTRDHFKFKTSFGKTVVEQNSKTPSLSSPQRGHLNGVFVIHTIKFQIITKDYTNRKTYILPKKE